MKNEFPHPRFATVFGIGTMLVCAELLLAHLDRLFTMSVIRDFWSTMQHMNLGLACLALFICGLRLWRYGRFETFLLVLSSLFVGNCLFAMMLRDKTTQLHPFLALCIFAVTCVVALRRIPPTGGLNHTA